MVDDQRQLIRGACPQRAQHHTGGWVQPATGAGQRLLGQHRHRSQTVARIHRARCGHPTGVTVDPQPQHRVPVQQRLQNHRHIGLGDPRRTLHHHRLVELLDRTGDGAQPAHDRCGQHLAGTVVNSRQVGIGETRDPGQAGDVLFGENVARPEGHAGRAGTRHHLHRQNAVAAEVEERVVDADALHTQHPRVYAGQDLLDRSRGSAIPLAINIFRRRQRANIKLAVNRQRQPRHHHHRRRHHIRRQPLRQRRTQPTRISRPGHIPHQPPIPRTILPSDHHRLIHPGQPG
ncbi:hypothetical protein LAUMK191_05650 [Mycobacterium attenuatum]|nr:hypothetical protein LAUMK191_05650 [Mycobacterium attenuatum]VBA62392.1 hypothetical protein LAUMK41_05783 [Mycobacterium attenuatum]